MKEDVRLSLIEMFGENNIDPDYVKKIKTNYVGREYKNSMRECKEYYAKIEERKKQEILENLNKNDLEKIVDLYMQDILKIYEKKNHAQIDIYIK